MSSLHILIGLRHTKVNALNIRTFFRNIIHINTININIILRQQLQNAKILPILLR